MSLIAPLPPLIVLSSKCSFLLPVENFLESFIPHVSCSLSKTSRMASHHPVLRGAEGEAFSAHLLLHAHSFGRIFEVEQKKTGPEPVITWADQV